MQSNKRPQSSYQGKNRPISGVSFQSGIGFSNALKNHTIILGKEQSKQEKEKMIKKLKVKKINKTDNQSIETNAKFQYQNQHQLKLLMNQVDNYRVALPVGKQEDISRKLWEFSNQQLKNNYNYDINDVKKYDNYQFLGKLGQKDTTLKELTFNLNNENNNNNGIMNNIQNVQEIKNNLNIQTLNSFNKLDIDRSIKNQLSVINKIKSRPATVKQSTIIIQRPITASNLLMQQRPMTSSNQNITISQSNKVIGKIGINTNNRPVTAITLKQKPNHIKSGKSIGILKDNNNNHNYNNEQIINNFIDIDVKEDLDESTDEVYRQIDNAKNIKIKKNYQKAISGRTRIQSSLLSKRPISGKQINESSQFFMKYNKIMAFGQKELPFEDLFDRNERTLTATFVKFGDLGYYSPVQRIGTYYQFITQLKITHLLEIINLQKTVTSIEKNQYQIPIQLGIINENNLNNKTHQKLKATTLFSKEDQTRIPIGLTIFPEFLEPEKEEDSEVSQTELAKKLFSHILGEMNGNYDPQYLFKSNYIYTDQQQWPETIQKEVQQSLYRYNEYIQTDIIRNNDVSQFNKVWLLNGLQQVDQKLLNSFGEFSRKIIKQIIDNYKISMKQSILDYILLSPLERNRLHISLLPRKQLNSNQRITREGAYSIQLYPQWHNTYIKAHQYLTDNLHFSNLIISQLQNWFHDFSHLLLVEIDTFSLLSKINYSLSFPQFIKIQTNFIKKTTQIFRHIWLRGAILIIKKFKFLKTSNQINHLFTFNGYQPQIKDLENQLKNFMNNYQSISLQTLLGQTDIFDENKSQDYHIFNVLFEKRQMQSNLNKEFQQNSNLNLEDLLDIRENHAFKFSLNRDQQLYQFNKILKENGWSHINKQNKHNILNCAEVLMGIQLQQIIENSYKKLEDFIFSFNKLQTLMQQYANNSNDENQIIEEYNNINNMIKKQSELQHTQQIDIRQLMTSKEVIVLQELQYLQLEKYNCKPFIKLTIQIDDNNNIQFTENEDEITKSLQNFLHNILNAFNKFRHPAQQKIIIENKEESKQQKLKTKFQQDQETESNYLLEKDHIGIYQDYIKKIKLKKKVNKQKNIVQSFLENNLIENQDIKTKKYIKVIMQNQKKFQDSLQQITNHVIQNFQECYQTFRLFDQFQPFIQRQIQQSIQEVLENPKIQQEEYRQLINIIIKYKDLIEQIPDSINFPMFEINNKIIKKKLKSILDEQQQKILNHFEEVIIQQMQNLNQKYVQIQTQLKKTITNAQQNQDMELYKDDLSNKKLILNQQSNEIFKKMAFFLKLERTDSYILNINQMINSLNNNQQIDQNNIWKKEMFDYAKNLFDQPVSLERELKNSEEKHTVEHTKLQNELKKDKDQFALKIEAFQEEIKEIDQLQDWQKYKQNLEMMKKYNQQLQNIKNEMDSLQDREEKLQGYVFNQSYDGFYKIESLLKPMILLWQQVFDYHEFKKEWQLIPMKQVNCQLIEQMTKEGLKNSMNIQNLIEKQSLVSAVVTWFKSDTTETLQQMPVIEILSNKGFKQRHYNQINQIIQDPQFDLDFDRNSYKEILMTNFGDFIQDIEKISEQASKEYKLELMLESMQKEWRQQNWKIIKYKNFNILQGQCVDDLQQILDDHIYKAQTIRQNPHVHFMEQQAISWEQLMLYIDEVLDLLVQVQQQYLHLEPIFSQGEINASLSIESTKFIKVKEGFNNIINQCIQFNKIIDIMTIPNMKIQLTTNLKMIEEIQKGLEKFLEVKRIEFPRFFFLSNEDLLTILAETKDPFLVQPHIKKCFEGIQLLEFDNAKQIIGMISSEQETITFLQKINTKEFQSSVEKWLGKVEKQMKSTLEKITEESFLNLQLNQNQQNYFSEWIFKYPSQVVQTVSQIQWTIQTEESIIKNNLGQYFEQIIKQLQEIVNIVRRQLSSLEIISIGTLIVQMVHNKDLVEQLKKKNINSIYDFYWEQNLRYYQKQDSQFNTYKIQIKVMTASEYYGFEYLGNQSRLVITELTDRCYRTLMCALQLNLGGAPEGPAGTGKTETVKDLAKTMAQQCMVFNCSEGLQTHNMAKFFKGLACTGSWSCFDEFNRIDVEVLSVVASQILQIQQAKKANKTKFDFEGTLNLILKSTCNIFITMNPGYSGRSELPENLKVLFRPVAMMVPEYSMIAEISLYSQGFIKARQLAQKIVFTYSLCQEQLSKQLHYDYGMRAVKTTLSAVQQLKKLYSITLDEEQIVLKALIEVNMPKFLEQDIDLFKGIISDLFPGVVQIQNEMSDFSQNIDQAFIRRGYQNITLMKNKIYQLQETINVRHGLMIVGQAFSGKSSIYKVLMSSKNLIKNNAFSVHVINPKALTLNQIYGQSDPISKEWTEGVLGDIFRRCSQFPQDQRHCILFDGPVSTEWIENMNTVLDDNKKLCLMNAESISMTNMMTMMFEVDDLQHASPATISRNGMIYLSDNILTFSSIIHSFFIQPDLLLLQQHYSDIYNRIQEIIDATLHKSINFVLTKCKQYLQVSSNSIVQSLLNMYKALLEENKLLKPEFIKTKVYDNKIDEIFSSYDILYIESLKWCLGGRIIDSQRNSFSQFLKQLTTDQIRCEKFNQKLIKFDKMIQVIHTTQHNCFDYIITQQYRWKLAKDYLNEILDQQKKETQVQIKDMRSIVVETSESLQLMKLMDLSIKYEYPLLLVGKSGTGKTLYTKKFLNSISKKTYSKIDIQFSGQTVAKQTQSQIEKGFSRRKKGVYGPKLGMKIVVFIDDLGLSKQDNIGAQSSIELLRQLIDQKGWYNQSEQLKYQEIVDTNYIGAMGIPVAGINNVSKRFIRHFQYVSICENNSQSLFVIFNTVLEIRLHKNYNRVLSSIIEFIISVYDQIQIELKPTPNKPHYIFNLRDIYRIVQGISQFEISDEQDKSYIYQLIRLSIHEMNRCFYDRLINNKDRKSYYSIIQSSVRQKLKDDFKNILIKSHLQFNKLSTFEFQNKIEVLESILFNDLNSNQMQAPERNYSEIIELQQVSDKIHYYLQEYNTISKKPMDLVLFDYAIYNLIKITRAIKLEQGNIVFIGLGGSGRNSLSKFAIYLREYELLELEMNQNYNKDLWKQDLQRIMLKTGLDQTQCCLIIQDSQIKVQNQFILEDLNSLLNTGDVPNIFSQEEQIPLKERIMTNIKKDYGLDNIDSLSNQEIYDYFIKSVGKHLHLIITMNPISNELRVKIRNYPSLVDCTNIIWYDNWPVEALVAVAEQKLENNCQESKQNQITVIISKIFYLSAQQLSTTYSNNESRQIYITPSTFLQFLNVFNKLIIFNKQKLNDKINKYQNGSFSLKKTTESIKIMEEELIERQPEIIRVKEETDELAQQIKKQVEAMLPIKLKVEEEEKYVKEKYKYAQEIKDQCELDLSKAKPQLKKAEDSLDKIDLNDLIIIKQMITPPEMVKLVFSAVCVLLEEQPVLTPNPQNPTKKVLSYWDPIRALLSKPKEFVNKLKGYDKDNIQESVIEKLRSEYLTNPNFNLKKVEQASNNAKSIFEWILALNEYFKVLKIVRPKLAKLDEANQQVLELETNLKAKVDELDTLNHQITELQNKYNTAIQKQQELEFKIINCQLKIKRANLLIGGLKEEKERWFEAQNNLRQGQQFLFGDILLSAAIIVYLGGFTKQYRVSTIREWEDHLKKNNVVSSKDFKLQNVVGEAIQILQWNMNELPKDQYSIENGLIYEQNSKFPLFIDPQLQANKWIKNLELNNGLKVTKQTDNDFIRVLETAIQLGQPLLIQNVGQDIASILDPLLSQQFFKQAGTIMIKVGDNNLEYSKDFKLFLTTKLSNPTYSPEIYAKLNIINFMLTQEALQDQLLEIAIQIDEPECDDDNIKLIQDEYSNNKQLIAIEDNILQILQNSENILDNEDACVTLQQSKKISTDIYEKQILSKQTLLKIQEKKVSYYPIANHAAILFQISQSIQNLDYMYQYSLEWFVQFYNNCFKISSKSNYVQERIDSLFATITEQFFLKICQGLYQEHKNIFVFIMFLQLKLANNEIDIQEYNYLLAGDISGSKSRRDPKQQIPLKDYINENMMDQLTGLQKIVCKFSNIVQDMMDDQNEWVPFLTENNVHFIDLPFLYNNVTPIQRMCLIKVLRPDKVLDMSIELIKQCNYLGKKFTIFPTFSLQDCYKESNSYQPLMFMLPGNDPQAIINKLAKQNQKQLKIISLGQGQGVLAEQAIKTAHKNGDWVLLQNCHLYPSWLNKLEEIIEQLMSKTGRETSHPSFRLFLTTFSSQAIPIAILQNSIKITNESPIGINYNLQSSLKLDILQDFSYFQFSNSIQIRNFTLSLILFHAVILERKTFHSLGWNIQYDFNQSDLFISLQQLHMLLQTQQADNSFLMTTKYLIGECNYGGRVTDDKDRRMLKSLLDDFFQLDILEDNFRFKGLKIQLFDSNSQSKTCYEDIEKFVKKLDNNPSPELFGLHSNSLFIRNINQGKILQDNILSCMTLNSNNKENRNQDHQQEQIKEIIDSIKGQIPQKFDVQIAEAKFPYSYHNSINTVLIQELNRFNKLTQIIYQSLSDIEQALEGSIPLSQSIESIFDSLKQGRVPQIWLKYSYPSNKSLGDYITDLSKRLSYFYNWINIREPIIHWISGYFFIQSFLTSILQNNARKYNYAIDTIEFEFQYMEVVKDQYCNNQEDIDTLVSKPIDGEGNYIQGMFMEGGDWDAQKQILKESQFKVLLTKAPIIYLKPSLKTQILLDPKLNYYDCPLYNTLQRQGTLSTTGHSTNFIIFFKLPTDKPTSHWIKRSLAFFCQKSQGQ